VLFLRRWPNLLAVGTDSGSILFYEVRAKELTLRAVERAHCGPVTVLAEQPDGEMIVSAGQDGVIRRSYLRMNVLGQAIDLPELFLNPDANRAGIETLFTRSAAALHQRVDASGLQALSVAKMEEARREYFGRQLAFQVLVTGGGKLARRADGAWIWEQDGKTVAWFERYTMGNSIWISPQGSTLAMRFPRGAPPGSWWSLDQVSDSLVLQPMGAITKTDKPDEYLLSPSLISNERDGGWRVQSGKGNVEWTDDPGRSSLVLPAVMRAMQGGAQPDGGRAATALPLQLKRYESLPPKPRFTWYADAEDFSAFENLSLNGQGNVTEVLPGDPVRLSVRWSAGPNRSDRSCPGCIFQVYLGFYDPVHQQGKSWCLMSRTLPSPVEGLLREEFQAPLNPGVYLLTTYESPMNNCSDLPANHAFNGMGRAVGAIVVRKRSTLPD
jgi:hypothetical protein